MGERFTFFWKGPFSQWHSSFFEIDGTTYSCAEQYMMAEKARFFGDEVRLKEILFSNNPRDQKIAGRKVMPFHEEKWNKVAKDVVYRGSYTKYTQNPELKKRLLSTAGTTLVEASPYDKIWGIGLGEQDPRAQNRKTWQGKNWLGQILTEVREKIIEEG